MVFAILYLLAGALAFWGARRISSLIRAGRDWPAVMGRVLERGLGPPMSAPGRSFLPLVRYRYAVGGRDYENDQVHLIRGTGGNADAMRKLADSIPDPVPVHYDPADPSRSYLLANSMSTYWIVMGMGVLSTALGLGQLLIVAARGG